MQVRWLVYEQVILPKERNARLVWGVIPIESTPCQEQITMHGSLISRRALTVTNSALF